MCIRKEVGSGSGCCGGTSGEAGDSGGETCDIKRSSVSLENRGSKKRKSLEQIMLHMFVRFHSSETLRGATSPALVRGA